MASSLLPVPAQADNQNCNDQHIIRREDLRIEKAPNLGLDVIESVEFFPV